MPIQIRNGFILFPFIMTFTSHNFKFSNEMHFSPAEGLLPNFILVVLKGSQPERAVFLPHKSAGSANVTLVHPWFVTSSCPFTLLC